MNVLVVNQVEAQGVSESYPVFQEIARRRQAIRRVLSNLTVPRIYRAELNVARRIGQVIDHHPTLSNVGLWAMGIAFFVEILMKG